MKVFAALLLLALGAAPASAHTLSLGSSRFEVADDGGVAIAVEVEERDVLELFDLDPSRPEEARLLERRAAGALTRFLRLTADGRRCPLSFEGWERSSARGVRFSLAARCPAPIERLTIDWGLATLTPLDLQSAAAVTAPGGIEHAVLFSRRAPRAELVVRRPSALSTFGRFLALGVEHILLGWDHLAFLLALLVGCARYRRLLLVVSGFTVAHSVTLALGALGVVRLAPSLVEPVIAASIAVAALWTAARLHAGARAHPGGLEEAGTPTGELALVFGFGLVHGLGFASLLEEALDGTGGVALPLLGFNLGVELGQLLAVSAAFPALVRIGRRARGRAVLLALLFALVALGAWVAVDRALGG